MPARTRKENYRDMKKLVTVAEWVVAVFGTLIGAILLAEKIFYSFDRITREYCFNLQHVILGCLIYGTLLALIYALAGRICSTKKYITVHIVITLFFEIAFCLVLMWGSRIYWDSDAGAVYDLAVRFAQGDYSAVVPRDSYLAIWPFQYGIISVYEILMRCVGTFNGKLIQAMNLGLLSAGTLASYGILWKISPRRLSVTANSLLWMTFYPFFFHATIAYGDLPAICLVLVAVWFLLRVFDGSGHKGVNMILTSVALIFACIFKTNTLICLTAVALVSGVLLLKKFDVKKVLWLVLTIILSVQAVPTIQRIYEIRAGQESGDGIPMITYIAMSMQEGLGGPGSWNGYHADLYLRNNYDRETTTKQAKQDINKSVEHFVDNPEYMLDFYVKKVAYQWTEGSYDGVEVLECTYRTGSKSPWVKSIVEGSANAVFTRIANWHQSVLYVAFIVSMLMLVKDLKKGTEFAPGKMYLTVMIIGGFLFELIWESASRYVMMYCVMMFPLAAEGVSWIYDAAAAGSWFGHPKAEEGNDA